jgi:pimeloyl-ACP methyl ester carboxylesterase
VKRSIVVHGTNLAVVDEGNGPPVLLLHGYPDSSRLWRHQIPVLLEAGFRVIAPDLRGFGDSDKPQQVEDYGLMTILSDVTGIMSACDVRRAHVVGHDWGATVAWLMASLMPRRVDRVVVLSVGHPRVFHHPSLEQRQRFWYMLLYQFEGVAEELLTRQNFRFAKDFYQEEGDTAQYLVDFRDPRALRAGLNWYRANRHPASELAAPQRMPPIMASTLGVWSSGDRALLEESMLASAEYVAGPWRYERIENASHWIPLDAPEELNRLLLSFLAEASEPLEAVDGSAIVRRRF